MHSDVFVNNLMKTVCYVLNFASQTKIIVHQVKTKKIITVKEVWIPGLNQHRFLQFYFFVFSLFFVSIEKIY